VVNFINPGTPQSSSGLAAEEQQWSSGGAAAVKRIRPSLSLELLRRRLNSLSLSSGGATTRSTGPAELVLRSGERVPGSSGGEADLACKVRQAALLLQCSGTAEAGQRGRI
jgi:hypothetical protein